MLDHVGFSVSDFQAARRFYDAALAPLGVTALMQISRDQTGGYEGAGYGKDQKPFFWIGSAGGPASTRTHVAFAVDSRDLVEAFYAAAMAAGGKDNGEPGLRPHYHPNYYGAFVLDPDGNNIEAVCHKPPA